jgi:integrase
LHLVIFIAAVTGTRRGEILALIWEDIDFDVKEIRIRRALRHNATTKRPKSKSGTRTLALPDELAQQLLEHRRVQDLARESYGAAYDDRGFVFAESDGRPWKPNSISTLYRRIVRDAEIGKVKLHELRHSLASILIANGVDIATVAKILGHADKAFTLRQYVHSTSSNDRKADSVMRRRARAAA